jgi:histidyl-tRNA synthetase
MIQPVRGTKDLYGADALKFRTIMNCFLNIAARFGCDEIATPIFEFTEVFSRSLGEATDVVAKEMYTFSDRGGESLTLRPEGTAGIVRAFLSEGMKQNLPLKFAYSGPMFRYERPQKGRYRQFHQIGVEYLGFDSPDSDAELVMIAHLVLRDLGIVQRAKLHLNSIGDAESRLRYREALVHFLTPFRADLSPESQVRLDVNPLRILDSKSPKDQEIIAGAPQLHKYLTTAAVTFFNGVQERLSDVGVPFVVDQRLVRGLDYYTHTVFEFRTADLGAQDAILAGGRYDGLVEMLGGSLTPSVGWAAGMERLALLLTETQNVTRPVALIPLGEAAERRALQMSFDWRSRGLHVELSQSGNLAKRLKRANKAQAKWAVIFGESELSAGNYQLKNLDSGDQTSLSPEECFVRVSQNATHG